VSAEIILRQRSGPIITIVVWVFLALLLGDALVRGAWETVARFGPALLIIGWIAFTVLWRPALIVGYEAVEVRELVRTTTVPFARIRDIRLGSTVAIETASANGAVKTIRPWSAPGRPRRKTDSGITGGTRPEPLDSHPSFGLFQRWERARADEPAARRGADHRDERSEDATVVTRWNLGVIGVTTVLAGLVAVGLI